MSAFTDKRAQVQAELTSLTSQLHDRLAQAGAALIESGELPQEEPYLSLAEREQHASDEIAELTQTRERIVSIGERLAEIDRMVDEVEKRGKEIAAELDPHYQTIGEHAFRVFRDNPLIDQEYADIFTPVLNAAEELRQTRSELEQAEAELSEKPFLEKMVLRGRIIVLRNRVALRETQLDRLYRDSGRQIAATDFITTIGDPALDQAAAPFLDLLEESQRKEREIGALSDERAALRDELKTLGVDRRPGSRLNELDAAIEEAESRRAEVRASIATAANGADIAGSLGEEIQQSFESIGSIEAAQEAARERLKRLDAAIRIEQLASEIDQIDSGADRKRQQVASLTADIDELERRKAGLEAQVAEAKQTRGPVEELLG